MRTKGVKQMSEPKPTDYYQGQSVSDGALFALPWHLANVVKTSSGGGRRTT